MISIRIYLNLVQSPNIYTVKDEDAPNGAPAYGLLEPAFDTIYTLHISACNSSPFKTRKACPCEDNWEWEINKKS